LQIEIQDYHRDQLEKDGISLPPREETVLTLSGNFTQKELDKAAKKGTKKQSNIAAPSVENPLPDETLSDAIAATKKQITYNLNHDGSVILRSLRGITDKQLKRMSDDELRAIGLFKTLRGKDEKFFPNDETLELRYQEKSKPSAATAKPKSKSILTRPEALAIAQKLGFNGTGQNLYDWAKAALTAKSDESRLANSEKLAAVGLVAVFSPEKKPAWQAKSLV
jgi:hypothetical protein